MGQEVQTFNMNDLKNRVADSVKATIGMLIPNEKWDVMIDKEVKAFFEETNTPFNIAYVNSGYSRTEVLQANITPFRALVWERCAKIVIPILDKAMHANDGPVAKHAIDYSYKLPISSELTEVQNNHLEQMLPKMCAALFRDVYKFGVEQSRNDMIQAFASLGTVPNINPTMPQD